MCGSVALEVLVSVWARLIQERDNVETVTDEASDRHQDWSTTSPMKCCDCGFWGTAWDFALPHKPKLPAPEACDIPY